MHWIRWTSINTSHCIYHTFLLSVGTLPPSRGVWRLWANKSIGGASHCSPANQTMACPSNALSPQSLPTPLPPSKVHTSPKPHIHSDHYCVGALRIIGRTKAHALSAHMQSDTQWCPGLHTIIQLYAHAVYCIGKCWLFPTMQCRNRPLLACHWWCYELWIHCTVDSRYNKLLGPSEITLLYKKIIYPSCKNNKIQRNFELWDQQNYFVISVFFVTRVHCIPYLPFL